MKSPKLRSLLLWLVASVVMTITFRMATTSRTAHSQPTRHTTYYSRIEREPSAHLVEAALRKADFPQMLSATERSALTRPLLMPSGITLLPDHSLMVENIFVVEDPIQTWDQCLANPGTQSGPWTFNTLMTNVRNGTTQQAEQMLTDLIGNFANSVPIGSFTIHPRPDGQLFFNSWLANFSDPHNQCTNPTSQGPPEINCLSLATAPVHLNAIVNRIDIGQNGGSDQAGQLRFVFGVEMFPNGTIGCGSAGTPFFNIILEYNVPNTDIFTGGPITAQSWASQWANLSTKCLPTITSTCAQNTLDPLLLAITSQVTTAGAGGSGAPNGSALFDLRTNEVELNPQGGNNIQPGTWELRQFLLGQSQNPNELVETAVPQTPDLSFDGGLVPNGPPGEMFCSNSGQDPDNRTPGCSNLLSEAEVLIEGHAGAIVDGTFNLAQAAPGAQGASALNGPAGVGTGTLLVFWNSSPSMQNDQNLYQARVIFAASPQVFNPQIPGPDPFGGIDGTCNGCHGAETQTGFQQVVQRTSGTGNPAGSGDVASSLSAFLVGCNNGNGILTGICPNPFPLNSPGNEVVQDPVFGPVNNTLNNTFGDIQRRVNCMNTILNPNSPLDVLCNGAGNLGN
ncbi:MAG: hypothetical protein ABSD98_17440 [Candidatus Korobacteraceae bacterium]|jgi:hypothetical protein